jgi:hypothetical protein
MLKLDPATEDVIRGAIEDQMYGTVELKFERGVIVLIRFSETIKPTNYRNTLGSNASGQLVPRSEAESGTDYQRRS